MLDSLRNAAKSWVAKTLIFLLAASFGVWGVADVFTGYYAGALATVGGEEVTQQQYNRAFNLALQRLSDQTGQNFTAEDARKFGIDRQVLSALIQDASVDNQGKALGLSVGDALIVRETQANPAFQDSSGKFDAAEFKRRIEAAGFTEAGYLATEREARRRGAITDTVQGGLPASKTLVEAFYRHKNEQRDARYFVVPTAESEVAAPTDTEIKAQYDANPASYTAPEYRVIALMTAEPGAVAGRITITDEAISAGYEKYKLDYFTPEKRTVLQLTFPSVEEAQKVKDRLAAGEDFMAIAAERGLKPEDVTFADKTKTSFLDPAIAEAAFTLAEGSVSEPIKGALSTALIKIAKVSPENQKTLEEVKDELSARLRLEAAKEEISSIYDAVESARDNRTSFEDISAAQNIVFKLAAPIDAAGLGTDGKAIELTGKEDLLRAAFESDVGVDNSALQIGDGYLWYEVREVVPSRVKPLEDVRAQVIADISASKVRALSAEKAKKLAERAIAGVSLDTLAQEAGVPVQSAQGLKRNESSPSFGAEAVAALFAVTDTGFAFAVEPDGKGARVMQSQPVLLPAFDPASEEAKTIAQQLQSSEASDVLQAYLGALQKETGVAINETLWRQISGTQTQ